MNSSNVIIAAEIASELAEMFPVEPWTSTADRIVASKLSELIESLGAVIEILTAEEAEFEAHMERQWEEQWDARHDCISAHWGHD